MSGWTLMALRTKRKRAPARYSDHRLDYGWWVEKQQQQQQKIINDIKKRYNIHNLERVATPSQRDEGGGGYTLGEGVWAGGGGGLPNGLCVARTTRAGYRHKRNNSERRHLP